jgi:radical SAM superfamily enzyme YgiQ (UPF0313 family)
MKVTFIMPCVGRKPGSAKYIRSWLMEPLALAALAGLTPRSIDRICYDDRLEAIPYDEKSDLVAINTETYTARRAYQIAAEYRKRKVPVVMGGFHATLMPDEVQRHCDAVVIGPAEKVWPQILEDCASHRLGKRYKDETTRAEFSVMPDRSIYQDKRYSQVTLVETARGCRYTCEFCSISAFFEHRYTTRPIQEVVDELKQLNARNIFFVDDNLFVNRSRSIELLQAIKPLNLRWVGQVSIDICKDLQILQLLADSGCAGVLIGFESLNPDNLDAMGKRNNLLQEYDSALAILRRYGLAVYGTFVFGYDHDTRQTFETTLHFAQKHKLFFAAFNHLVPFPGTPLYNRLHSEQRLLYDAWWLDDSYRFGDIAFKPNLMSAQDLSETCRQYRKKFYSSRSVLYRSLDRQANCKNVFMAALYLYENMSARIQVDQRQGLPLGIG